MLLLLSVLSSPTLLFFSFDVSLFVIILFFSFLFFCFFLLLSAAFLSYPFQPHLPIPLFENFSHPYPSFLRKENSVISLQPLELTMLFMYLIKYYEHLFRVCVKSNKRNYNYSPNPSLLLLSDLCLVLWKVTMIVSMILLEKMIQVIWIVQLIRWWWCNYDVRGNSTIRSL